jgi:HAD superfamily hydrolase (TIGR01450 family)
MLDISFKKQISNIKAVVFDLDGTVYQGDSLISGADETIKYCHEKGYKIFFLSNNSVKTQEYVRQKLHSLGIICDKNEVFTSIQAAVLFFKENHYKNIFAFASDDIIHEFQQLGIQLSEPENAEHLYIAFNPNSNYEDLTKAIRAAIQAKTITVANMDATYPGENGHIYPACGPYVQAILYGADKDLSQTTNIGKPNTMMLDFLAKTNNLLPAEILIVGDNYNSDIVMAKNFGCYAVWLGGHSEEKVLGSNKIVEIIEYL